MNEKTLILISEIILASTVITALVIILVAAWYDMRAITSRKQLQRIASKLDKSRQPWVTIIIYTHNHSSLITKCLDSIQGSRYANYRIVVADHGSTDTTRQLVKSYQKHHKKVPITLYNARLAASRTQAIERAVSKAPTSQLVLTLDGSVLLGSDILRNSASHFAANTQLASLHLRRFSERSTSLAALIPQFIALANNIIHKALSILHLLPRSSDLVMISTSSISPDKRSNLYASTITYTSLSNIHRKHSVKKIALLTILWLIIIAMMSYWFWTAANLRSNLLLTLSWIAVCVWLLAIVWSDDVMRITKKIELSVSIPFMYFAFYAQAIMNFFVGLWRLIRVIPFRAFATAFKAELYSTRY